MQMMEDIYTTRDEYAFNFFGGAEGETWQVDDRGYAVSIPGTGSAKDSAEGTRLGVRMFVGHVAHIVPPVDKVYIAPNRHALQGYFEQTQAPGPPIGFRPTWDEAERALVATINTIEQEFYRSDRRRFGLGRLPRADDERRPRPAAGFGGRAALAISSAAKAGLAPNGAGRPWRPGPAARCLRVAGLSC